MIEPELLDCRVLAVDDEPANVALLKRLLQRFGFQQVASTTDARQTLSLCRSFQPDLVLLDLLMPHLDGYEVLQQLSAEIDDVAFVPKIVLTADIRPEAKRRALDLGATDFLTKPFDATELMLRTRNALRIRRLSLQQQEQNQTLEQRVFERTRQLEIARLDVVERLARVCAVRDDETYHHTLRVGRDAAALARILNLGDDQIELIRRAAPLHDIGKIGIPDSILRNPGRLSAGEIELMKQHTLLGAQILEGGRSELMRTAAELALSHHERWDGSGYPHGIRGAQIPLVARIVSVVDVLDALTHARAYKPAWPLEQAILELKRERGRQFDPAVVDAMLVYLDRAPEGDSNNESVEDARLRACG